MSLVRILKTKFLKTKKQTPGKIIRNREVFGRRFEQRVTVRFPGLSHTKITMSTRNRRNRQNRRAHTPSPPSNQRQ